MKNILLLLGLLSGGGVFYVHQAHPRLWDRWTHIKIVIEPENPLPPPFVSPAPPIVKAVPIKPVAMPLPPPVERIFIPPAILPVQPNWTWATTTGKVYRNVVVKKVEADCVTILDEDGGARIDISTLPVGIQKQLNYDPELAVKAAKKRAEEEAYSTDALAKERTLADQLNQEKAILDNNEDVTDDQAIQYTSDLSCASGHVVVDSMTGYISGDPYWVERYKEDKRIVDLHDHQRQDHLANNSAPFHENGISEQRSEGFRREDSNRPSVQQRREPPPVIVQQKPPAPPPPPPAPALIPPKK